MNYEDMSDFEINTKVTAKLFACEDWSINDAEFYHCGIGGDEYFSIPIEDYCNNPADAWPIISGNKISIEYRDHKSLAPVAKRFGSNGHNIADKNPLRAAMIVFLMTDENKNDN